LHHGVARGRTRIPAGRSAGPVEHVKIGRADNHWLTPLASTVEAARPAPAPSAPAELALPRRG